MYNKIWKFEYIANAHDLINLHPYFKYEHFTPAFLLQNNLCEFTGQEYKFQGDFLLKTGFKPSLRFLLYKTKSDTDFIWQIQLISFKG